MSFNVSLFLFPIFLHDIHAPLPAPSPYSIELLEHIYVSPLVDSVYSAPVSCIQTKTKWFTQTQEV